MLGQLSPYNFVTSSPLCILAEAPWAAEDFFVNREDAVVVSPASDDEIAVVEAHLGVNLPA